MRISDWSSDVCSSDLSAAAGLHVSRIDGSPIRYNNENPYLPDLLICRPELADEALRLAAAYRADAGDLAPFADCGSGALLLAARLVTSGCPETGMKREVRCNSGAAPATVTGEADANMPLVLWHREGRIHPRPGSQETCQSVAVICARAGCTGGRRGFRSEEHTSELPSLMSISYAVFC